MPESSLDLVTALRRSPNDTSLREKLFVKLYPAVFYTTFKVTNGNKDRALDITQQAFFRFLERKVIERVHNEEEACAYLRQIARHLAWDEHRRRKRYVSIDQHSSEYRDDEEGARLPWEGVEVIDEHLLWDLDTLAGRLNSQDRDLLELLIKGHSLPEVARRLELNYSAAGARIHRLRKLLSKSLNLQD